MIIDNRYIFLNADDEFPNCLQCDGCTDCDPKFCGAENGWKNYRRKIRIPDTNEKLFELLDVL